MLSCHSFFFIRIHSIIGEIGWLLVEKNIKYMLTVLSCVDVVILYVSYIICITDTKQVIVKGKILYKKHE